MQLYTWKLRSPQLQVKVQVQAHCVGSTPDLYVSLSSYSFAQLDYDMPSLKSGKSSTILVQGADVHPKCFANQPQIKVMSHDRCLAEGKYGSLQCNDDERGLVRPSDSGQ